jgi:NADH:ubiquinone reductase (non-electrogenic)
MASQSRALSKLAVPQTGAALLRQSQNTPRLFLQASRRTVGARPVFGSTQGPVSRQFRRGISNEAAPAPPPKKSRFRMLRWTWRLGYLSALAGVAYIGYGVYQDRNPQPQIQPDPSKKTLVILGKPAPASVPAPADSRMPLFAIHLLTRPQKEPAGALSRC